MSTEQNKLREIFDEAVAKGSLEERDQYLASACAQNPELRRQVDSLLLAHKDAGDFLHQNVFTPDRTVIGEKPGDVIGRYKLLQQIGEGGFGVVFMAEQQEPVRRMVALKIIKAGMDTREVIARFEAERQALALMDHPNIARVLDGGCTEGGRPYFVMDLVKGVPITEFCDQRRLSTQDRLRLFMHVCSAVQHAHQKGIIHRDLKPTNVLVTLHDGEPVPRVIDFGISKAIGQRLTEKTLFTRFEQLMGTPSYMSPEQAEWSGLDIDTRSDIYSLGVLLYELLTGTTPIEKETVSQAALDEIRRLIREHEAERPSQRLSRIRDRKLNPFDLGGVRLESAAGKQRSTIDPELDWVVLKALEKDRARRYETVSAFGGDIERHLQGEPVSACPPTVPYRVRKFIRRHKLAVAVGATVLVSILTGVVLAFAGYSQANRQRQRAESEAAAAKAINDFILNDLLWQANPLDTTNRNITVREVIDRASQQVGAKLAKQPLVEASMRLTLANLYLWLNEHLSTAEDHARRAVDLRTQILGERDPDTLNAMLLLANIVNNRGDAEEGLVILRRAAEIGRNTLRTENPRELDCLGNIASYVFDWGTAADAEELLPRLLDADGRGAQHWGNLLTKKSLATARRLLGRYSEAAALCEEVVDAQRLDTNFPVYVEDGLLELSSDYLCLGDYERAVELSNENLQHRRARWPKGHGKLTEGIIHAVKTCGPAGQWTNCIALCRELIDSGQHPEMVCAAWPTGATAALMSGDTNAWQDFAKSAVAKFAAYTNQSAMRAVMETCFLAPNSGSSFESAYKLSDLLGSRSPTDHVLKAVAEYRRGHFEPALKLLESAARFGDGAVASQASYLRAMIYKRTGNKDSAQTELSTANNQLEDAIYSGELGDRWRACAAAAITRWEAERLVLGSEVSPAVTSDSLSASREQWAPVRRHLNTGDRLAVQKKWSEANSEYVAALNEPAFKWDAALQTDPACLSKASLAAVLAKDPQQSERISRGISHQQHLSAELASHALMLTLISQTVPPSTSKRIAEMTEAIRSDPEKISPEELSLFDAMTRYRCGRFQDVLEAARLASNSPRLSVRSVAKIFHAMALSKLGQWKEGKEVLAGAETELSKHLTNLTGDIWWDMAYCGLVVDEARRVVGDLRRE